jgi:hypothetical protein
LWLIKILITNNLLIKPNKGGSPPRDIMFKTNIDFMILLFLQEFKSLIDWKLKDEFTIEITVSSKIE